MMAKMPTVTPSSDKIVRSTLDFRAFQANARLSPIRRSTSIGQINAKKAISVVKKFPISGGYSDHSVIIFAALLKIRPVDRAKARKLYENVRPVHHHFLFCPD